MEVKKLTALHHYRRLSALKWGTVVILCNEKGLDAMMRPDLSYLQELAGVGDEYVDTVFGFQIVEADQQYAGFVIGFLISPISAIFFLFP